MRRLAQKVKYWMRWSSFHSHNAICGCRIPQSWCSCAHGSRCSVVRISLTFLCDSLFLLLEGKLGHCRRSWEYYHQMRPTGDSDEIHPFDRTGLGV